MSKAMVCENVNLGQILSIHAYFYGIGLYIAVEPVDHALWVFFSEGRVCISSKAVGTVWETHKFDCFALAFEGDKELFALFDRTAIVDFTVHEQDGRLYFCGIGER